MISYVPIGAWTAATRPGAFPSFIKADGSVACTWGEFWRRAALVGAHVRAADVERWIVADEEALPFAVALAAVLLAGKTACLPRNHTDSARREIGGAATLSARGLDGCPATASLHPADREAPAEAFVPGACGGARLVLHTSGSTGEPKAVDKAWAAVEAELANIAGLWGPELAGRAVFSTVQHHHFYGMLFYILSPLCLGLPVCVDMVNYPENLADIRDHKAALVGSPAFYKRLADSGMEPFAFAEAPLLLSSGGKLPAEAAEASRRLLGAAVREIYGSTETGGIAWRLNPGPESWTPFAGIEVRVQDDLIAIRSPYVDPGQWYQTSDRGAFADGALRLFGRSDTVVKIEEKRVSLTEVENRLAESPLVAEARVVALEDRRQYLAVVAVLSPAGAAALAAEGKLALNKRLRAWLRTWFEATVLPRKWRFVAALPQDSMGKVSRASLELLFAAPDDPDGGIAVDRAAVDGDTATVDFHVPADALWFKGHFPGFALLPGVVQVDWLFKCAARYLGKRCALRGIPRIKFMKPITPDAPVRLELAYKPGQLSYKYCDRAGEPYSSGRLNVELRP